MPSPSYNENIEILHGRTNPVALHHGIMVRLHPDGTVTMSTPLDGHFPQIHPNCYAPAYLSDVHLLKGGGSGTAVFHGHSPELGSIVMKHGHARDSKEVFSLVTIRQELIKRGTMHPDAAEFMRVRIPEFIMVYISPHHVRDRQKELWTTLRAGTLSAEQRAMSPLAANWNRNLSPKERRSSLSQFKDEKGRRNLSIVRSSDVNLDVSFRTVDLCIPVVADGTTVEGGVETLQNFGKTLANLQDLHNWKVTLAQKTIGSGKEENGARVLTSGELHGALLATLMVEFTQVMRNLNRLTLPEERGSIEILREEVATLKLGRDVTKVPKDLDVFVGKAILKNYLPDTGRFAKLRNFGKRFRSYSADPNSDFYLTDDEIVPAKFLGCILEQGASPGKVFLDVPCLQTALDLMDDQWMDILEHATSSDRGHAAEQIWTCGLTDAGLHNTFLSLERGLELFDLGEPRCVSQPAFLTKFLMSVFHTSGMEENGTCWINRFCVINNQAALTPETKARIPYLYEVFSTVLDHFVKELFDSDEGARCLLIKYVVLQLLSDAAFCLGRWEMKGGGTARYGERASMCFNQWLWRSLWDLYIASHVYSKLLNPQLAPTEPLGQNKSPVDRAWRWWKDLSETMGHIGTQHGDTRELRKNKLQQH